MCALTLNVQKQRSTFFRLRALEKTREQELRRGTWRSGAELRNRCIERDDMEKMRVEEWRRGTWRSGAELRNRCVEQDDMEKMDKKREACISVSHYIHIY